MATVFFVLSFVLGFIAFLGLISPKLIFRKANQPSRGKVMLFLGLPSIILFVLFVINYESSWDEALKNPSTVTEVSLHYEKLTELPAEFKDMRQIIKLDLSKNHLTLLPEYLKDFDQLEELDLSENPMTTLPHWLAKMKSLKVLILDKTNLELLPEGLTIEQVSYKDTPLYLAENPEGEEPSDDEVDGEDDHSESLGEFALRQFMGRDYGYRRKFARGEIFYDQPVTKDQVDQIGEFMQMIGFFNEERDASMLLEFNDDVYQLKIVVNGEEALTAEVIDGFTSIEAVIQSDVFTDVDFQIVLVDDDLDALKVIE